MDDRTSNTGRSADEIRREIERTRSRMDGTVDAIGNHLSPGRIVDELWLRVRSGDHSEMISDGAGRVGRTVGHTIKEHPLPSAVIGLGLGLLAWEQVRERGGEHVGPGTYARAEGRVGPYRGEAIDRDDPDWEYAGPGTKAKGKVAEATGTVKDKVESVRDIAADVKDKAVHAKDRAVEVKERATQAKDRASEVGHRARERASEVGHRVQEKASAVAQTAREKVHDARDTTAHAGESVAGGVSRAADRTRAGIGRMLDENPLALAAIALGLGVAAGVSTPGTRWEDRRLGSASDTVKDEARRVGRRTVESARRVAGEAASAATDELRVQKEQGPAEVAVRAAAQQVKASAKEVARAAERAAREAAESEGLTREALKHEVEASRDRVRGRARAGSMGDD